ncbi:MAG: hypothetical protein K5852_10515 [Eubacterium sp.]|nr:hypothetical protein [Eubacterium sp.]
MTNAVCGVTVSHIALTRQSVTLSCDKAKIKKYIKEKHEPAKLKENQEPAKLKENQEPAKIKENQEPTELKKNQEPARRRIDLISLKSKSDRDK